MRAPALCSRRPEPVRNSQAHSLGRYRLFTTTGFESFLKLHVDDVPPSLKAGQGGMACPQSPGAAEHEGSHFSHIRSTTRIHETARSGRSSFPLCLSLRHRTDSSPRARAKCHGAQPSNGTVASRSDPNRPSLTRSPCSLGHSDCSRGASVRVVRQFVAGHSD